MSERHIVDQAYAKSPYYLLCCAKSFWNSSLNDFNITWTFASFAFHNQEEATSSFKDDLECHGQKLWTLAVDPLDAGNYTCLMKASDGTKHSRTISTYVYASGDYRGKPFFQNSSGPVYTKRGESVTLFCSFYMMGNGTMPPDIYWRKVFLNSSSYFEVIARTLPDVKESKVSSRDGIFLSELKLNNMTELHFGNYSCQMVTSSSVIFQNISVYDADHPEEELERRLEIIVAVAAIAASLCLVTSCIIYRVRFDIANKYRNTSFINEGDPRGSSTHDVFIIHGPSAMSWVHTVLLSRLETAWGFECFLPDRDLLAGEATSTRICEELEESRIALLVVTECLLRSRRGGFLLNQAILSSLKNSSKVLALILTDISVLENCPDESVKVMLKVLKCVKKIHYPLEFVPEPYLIDEQKSKVWGLPGTLMLVPDFGNVKIEKDDLPDTSKTKGWEVSTLMAEPELQNPKVEADYWTHQTMYWKQSENNKRLRNSLSFPVLPSPEDSQPRLATFSSLCLPVSDSIFIPNSLLPFHESDKILDSQKIVNIIMWSPEFAKTNANTSLPYLASEEISDRSEERRHPTTGITFPCTKRKALSSESSDCPISPCSDTPFFGEEGKQTWKEEKTYFRKLRDFFVGDPTDMFWKKLHFYLPSKSQKRLTAMA